MKKGCKKAGAFSQPITPSVRHQPLKKGGSVMRKFLIGFPAKTLFSLAVIIAVFGASQTFSKQLSPAQKEVWEIVEKYWAIWQEKGAEQVTDLVHKEAAIWGAVATFPGVRLHSGLQDGLGSIIDSFELKPYQIKTFSNVAIIQYESKGNFLGKPFRLRCTDIWMKEDGKWKIIGAMHDSCAELPSCP